MIGLDTNVLVRYLAQDDPQQSPLATELIEALTVDEPGYISIVSVVEIVWVLTSCYAVSKDRLCEILAILLQTKGILVAQADVVWQALRLFKKGQADFADCLIKCCAEEAGCRYVASFDRNAAKCCGMQLLA